MSGRNDKKLRQLARRNVAKDYRGFCDYINAQKFFMRLRFAWHCIRGNL